MRYSYNRWPASPDPDDIGLNRIWEPIPGHRFPGGIKSGDVEVIMTYLVQQLHARVERCDLAGPADEWGFAFRDNVNKPGQLSCHASATAIDYNATRHPNKVAFTWAHAQVKEIRQIIDVELEGVIRWLQGYDEMHFEIRGNAAAVKRVADKIRNRGKEPFTVGQYDEIMKAIGKVQNDVDDIKAGVLVSIAEGRELDEDLPENLTERTGELLRIGRAVADKVGAVVPPPNPG